MVKRQLIGQFSPFKLCWFVDDVFFWPMWSVADVVCYTSRMLAQIILSLHRAFDPLQNGRQEEEEWEGDYPISPCRPIWGTHLGAHVLFLIETRCGIIKKHILFLLKVFEQ
jgi:hypothetical protein